MINQKDFQSSYKLKIQLAGTTQVQSNYKVDLITHKGEPAIVFELLDNETKAIANWEKSDYQSIKNQLKLDIDQLEIFWRSPHYPDYQFVDDTKFR